MPDPEKIALRALAVLQGRKGFDHWWDSIDRPIRDEIINEMTAAVTESLEGDDAPPADDSDDR